MGWLQVGGIPVASCHAAGWCRESPVRQMQSSDAGRQSATLATLHLRRAQRRCVACRNPILLLNDDVPEGDETRQSCVAIRTFVGSVDGAFRSGGIRSSVQ